MPAPRAPSSARSFRLLAAAAFLTVAISGAWLLPDFLGLRIPGKLAATASALPQASGQVVTCPLEPASAVAGGQDGQFPFQPGVPGLTAADMATFLVIGNSAAASGRPRDAEVAFLMSCRLADKLKGAGSVESADGKLLLGAHYARLATGPDVPGDTGDAARPELLRRAEFLYLDSLRIYSAAYGPADEKSRVAADGLAAVRQSMARSALAAPARALQHAGAPPSPAGSIAEPVQAAELPPTQATPPSPVVARAAPVRAESPDAAQPQAKSPGMRADASFDCSRARSVSEKMICSDAELFQLNHEVGRVYARARDAAPDRADFGRRNEIEARRRESICRDRGCLLRWYAYRRDQLLREVQGRSQPGPTGWR